MFATLLTADLAVPRIVKERSTAIMARLTSPTVTQSEIAAAQGDLRALTKALDLLAAREAFRRAPSLATFRTFLTQADTAFPGLDAAERNFFLDALYQVTGVALAEVAQEGGSVPEMFRYRLELQPILGWWAGAAAPESVARGRLDSGLRAHLQAMGKAAQH